jgi:uncharacterized repeat protein (TIGR03803 family)
VLHTFAGSDGAYPCSQLALFGSAFWNIPTTVYGVTSNGGSSNYGVVFKVNTDGTGFADLYDFTGGSDGKYPSTGLLIYGNTLYGTTTNSLFKINTDGSDYLKGRERHWLHMTATPEDLTPVLIFCAVAPSRLCVKNGIPKAGKPLDFISLRARQ